MRPRSTRGFRGLLPGTLVRQSPQRGPLMRCLIPSWGAKLCAGVSGSPRSPLPRVQVLKPPTAPRSCPTCPDPVCRGQVGSLGDKKHQGHSRLAPQSEHHTPGSFSGWKHTSVGGQRASGRLRVCRGWEGGWGGPFSRRQTRRAPHRLGDTGEAQPAAS